MTTNNSRKKFNLAKAIAQGYAWTQSGDKVNLKEICIGAEIYNILGVVLSPGVPNGDVHSWTLTGRYVYRRTSIWDLTTEEP